MKKIILLLSLITFLNCKEDKTNTDYLAFKERIQHYYSMNLKEYVVVKYIKRVDTINAETYYNELYNEYKLAFEFYKEYPNKSKDLEQKAKYSKDVLKSISTYNKFLNLAKKHTRIYDSVNENMIKYQKLLKNSKQQQIIKVFAQKENAFSVTNYEDVYFNTDFEILSIKNLGTK
ncbi:MAG: hypothetical protein P8P88_02425 [Polaribacter sp.]|nr:hypothetical protein [Polaribacter sp.]